MAPSSVTYTNAWHREEGAPWPLGVQWIASEKAFNFAIYSKHATDVELLLFQEGQFDLPCARFQIQSPKHKSGPIWHIRIQQTDLNDAEYYAYRFDGPQPSTGYSLHQFDAQKLMLDPYARDIFFPPAFDRDKARKPGSNLGLAPLGAMPTFQNGFDWENDAPVRHDGELIIYELHVRGFTQGVRSCVENQKRGTFAGVIEKIPYLVELGITALELMPVFQFDPQQGDYWGYMPLSFFAPHVGYSTDSSMGDQHTEFREMVKQLHRAGIEVILDVVYNHTCEGGTDGPTYCFKGIDASTYYVLSGNPDDPFVNFSGTGNTLHTSNRAVRQLIIDSLRYWVKEMHVDGFRFDLASIFTRSNDGTICTDDPPIFGQISADPDLAGIRLIAEPWDMGAYQLGRGFPGNQWMQWNGAFQECLQKFVRGDPGLVPELMTRLYGSVDLFPDDQLHALRPFQSVNYVTSHDGFTLYDLVSYNEKHNVANGHSGNDGKNYDSWNCGWEGDIGVPSEVVGLRKRQAKNFFTLLMLSAGTPMFRMGDEFLQTQAGNNNPYNQDNETSWLDWERQTEQADFWRFCHKLIEFRKSHRSISRSQFWNEDVRWYGVNHAPDLSYPSRSIAFCLHGTESDPQDLYVMINAYWEPLCFGIYEKAPGQWKRVIDTSLLSPNDMVDITIAETIHDRFFEVQPRSVVVLVSE